MSLREGGVSGGPYASLNLSLSVGDEPAAVALNRARFQAAIPARVSWPWLEHGAAVVRLGPDEPRHSTQAADGCWTTELGVACVVTAADCMPVLFALRNGRAVGAAHAGWRGLSLGVLEATVEAMCAGTGAAPAEVQAWLGPCIGPRQFEVGADVLTAFGQAPGRPDRDRFVPHGGADGSPRWLANLPRLARDRLDQAGVGLVVDSVLCTVENPSRFFSFRRDRITGRMAAAIWRG
jgi:YfiH family protein